MKFVIEHLDHKIFKWSLIEYRHTSKIVGKENLIFTNIPKKDFKKLQSLGKIFWENCAGIGINNICVLSQHSEKTLEADDGKKFGSFIFGGILGDNPAKKRTAEIEEKLRQKGIQYETRNLGKIQMPTDVAAYVTKKILDGAKFAELKFVDSLEIEISENESVELNFRYVVDDNKVVISEELVEYLRGREEF